VTAPATTVDTIRIGADEAHVWVASPHQVGRHASLSVEEVGRWSRIRPLQARRSFAAAHALVRHALTWCVPSVPWASWTLAAAKPNGRPEVTQPPLGLPVRVNLSHTDGLVAVVVTLGPACGIDVEARPDAQTAERLAPRVLAPSELASWHTLGSDARPDRFCQLWTLKEATTKAIGLGLSLPFPSIGFDVDEHAPVRRADGSTDWSLAWWRPSHYHHLALAVHAPTIALVHHHVSEETHA
jgi:4'-phosphopantetheinyl transferase